MAKKVKQQEMSGAQDLYNFLFQAVRHMNHSNLCCGSIFGQEKNVVNSAIAKMNLFLHGASDFNIMQCAEMSYEPFSTVKSDSRYSNTFDLEDDTYSLYYFFDNRTMIKFFENTNFKSLVTVYQNY